MTSGVLGGGVFFVVIAVLWAAVLVPSWNRRREFKAAERNAFRLQRTLRILAETTEVPEELRLEANAKEALQHEKLLRSAQKRQEAEREAQLAEARAEQVRAEIRAQQMRRKQVAMQRAAQLRAPRVRRVRSLAALVAVVSFVGVLVGVGLWIAGSGVAVTLWSLLMFTLGSGTLVLLAPGRAKLEPIAAEDAVASAEITETVTEPALQATGETVDSAAAHQAAQRAAAARIERARSLARTRAARTTQPLENQPDSMLLREAREQVARERVAREQQHAAAPVSAPRSETAVAPTAAPAPAATSRDPLAGYGQRPTAAVNARMPRFSEMGRVGDTSEGMPDLDEVLRRRRAG